MRKTSKAWIEANPLKRKASRAESDNASPVKVPVMLLSLAS